MFRPLGKPKGKTPAIVVTIRSPRPDKHGSHPLIDYNMPIVAPGEKLPSSVPKTIPQEVNDLLNKKPKSVEKRQRKEKGKVRQKRKRSKKQKKQKKILGYTKLCLKWVIGVIVNRHYSNKQEWQFKDAIFDEDGKYRYCQEWGRLPIYEPFSKGGLKALSQDKLRRMSENIELFCKNKLYVILNLNGAQRTYWADKIKKQCEVERLKEIMNAIKKSDSSNKLADLNKSLPVKQDVPKKVVKV